MKEEIALIKERIENGDIFQHCEHKGKCKNCGAITDAQNDKYCWKCGKKLENTEVL